MGQSFVDEQSNKKVNVNEGERKLSIIGGAALLAYVLKKGSIGHLLLGLLGGELLYRGITGHCHLYEALEIDTLGQDKTDQSQEKKIDIRTEEKSIQENDYENWSKEPLYQKAREMDVKGRSNMTRHELILALRQHS